MQKKHVMQVAIGLALLAGGAWFSSLANQSCTRLVVDATWKSNGESRWQRMEIEAPRGRAAMLEAVSDAVKDIDGAATDIGSRTVESGPCRK
jgi:hypothetical protein